MSARWSAHWYSAAAVAWITATRCCTLWRIAKTSDADGPECFTQSSFTAREHGCHKITAKVHKITAACWEHWGKITAKITAFHIHSRLLLHSQYSATPRMRIGKSSLKQSRHDWSIHTGSKCRKKIFLMSNKEKFKWKSCQVINYSQSRL